jgi:hypothetical protein
MRACVRAATFGILVAVEVVLETAIVPCDQLRVISRQPAFGIPVRECPTHYV